MPLYACGYRPAQNLAHYRTLQALPLILGPAHKADADYLDACRVKRNTVEYDRVGGATEADAEELLVYCQALRTAALAWLRDHHPDLL